MSLKKDLTIIFVSFYSKNIIEKPINQIDRSISIIVVENSRDENLKKKLEKKYSNVKVLIPEKNKGNGGGINYGLNSVKTKYVLYLDVDVNLTTSTIDVLYNHANKLDNFFILGPSINNFEYKEEFYLKKNIFPNIHSMNFITGCALFFKKDVLDLVGFFDEKIFLYYEENDIYLRGLKKKFNIFLIDNAKIDHLGNQSTDIINSEDVEINRNWHLMWSTFYFHKKHYGLIKAYEKTIFKFFSAIIKLIFFSITFNKIKQKIYLARISGIINAMIGRDSWFRTNTKNIIDN